MGNRIWDEVKSGFLDDPSSLRDVLIPANTSTWKAFLSALDRSVYAHRFEADGETLAEGLPSFEAAAAIAAIAGLVLAASANAGLMARS